MKRFAILRRLETTTTREDWDAGAMQTLLNLRAEHTDKVGTQPNFRSVAWVRSYWHEGSTWGLCLYEAPELAEVANYHEICEVPYVEFRDVAEASADDVELNEFGLTALSEGESLFTIEAVLDATEPDEPAFATLPASLAGASGGLEGSLDHIRWVRAYWDEERGSALALYATREAGTITALAQVLEGSGATVRPVVEIAPGEYLG